MSERVPIVGSENFFAKLQQLSRAKLAKNEFLTLKLGANDSFHRARFKTYADLYKYINENFASHLSPQKRSDLIAKLSIVKVTMPKHHAKKKSK